MKDNIKKIKIENKENNLKLKGKATIQLFNEKTGQLEYEKVEENMITNAYKNIINPEFIQNNTNINIFNYLPIRNLFGGVLLFSDTIEENLENIIPTKNLYSHFIGNAGGVYAGTSKYRGSINLAESIADGKNYKYVWDFATNQANGEIKAIALTSILGGDAGLAIDEINDINSTSINVVGGTTIITGNYLCHINGDEYLRIKSNVTGLTVLEKVKTNENLKLEETTNGTTISEISITTNNIYDINRFDKNYIYGSSFTYDNTLKNLVINTIKISKTDFSITEDIYSFYIDLLIGTSILKGVYIGNKFYITKSKNNQLFIIDLTDKFNITYESITVKGNGCNIFGFMDTVSIISPNQASGIKNYYILDENNNLLLNKFDIPVVTGFNFSGFKGPRFIYGYSSSGINYIVLSEFKAYLASINNVASFTKYNTQTLKITYEISVI